jgi:DNA-binding transcriptional LysR family regulator
LSKRRNDLNKLVEMSTFVSVVDTGNLAAAARALGTSKSVVSARIGTLEARLKVALFSRERQLHVNDAGLRFYEHCVSILDNVASAEDGMQSSCAGFSGNLRIATPMALGLRYLSPILTEFAVAHPDLRLDIRASDDFVTPLDESFDLIIRAGRIPDRAVVAKPLVANRLVICASPQYLPNTGHLCIPSSSASMSGCSTVLAKTTVSGACRLATKPTDSASAHD